jgi:hypothetical protein
MRILGKYAQKILAIAALSLATGASLFPQAVCRTISAPAVSSSTTPIGKATDALGDPSALKSLKAIRYTTLLSTGADANMGKIEVVQTRVFPDRLVFITRIAAGGESYMEATPAGAFTQPTGGTRTNLPNVIRDELLKTVRLDRFYIGQNIASGKVTVTDMGTDHIGDVDTAVLRLNVEGAEVIWYVGQADGLLLRTIAKVPGAGGMVDSMVNYSDWRNCDGLTVPFQRTIIQGDKTSQEKVISVELNPNTPASPLAEPTKPVASSNVPAHSSSTAGGAWLVESQKDAMTDQSSVVYSLSADEQNGYIAFRCSGQGRFDQAWFAPGVVLDNSTTAQRGLLGGDQPNQSVHVAIDSKHSVGFWFVSADLKGLTIGKHDLEEILAAKDYRIQFAVAFKGSDVRKFSPNGLDRQLVKRACGF